jgi:hypothetical protein
MSFGIVVAANKKKTLLPTVIPMAKGDGDAGIPKQVSITSCDYIMERGNRQNLTF